MLKFPTEISYTERIIIFIYYFQQLIFKIKCILKVGTFSAIVKSTQHHSDVMNNTCLQTLGRQALKGKENVCH